MNWIVALPIVICFGIISADAQIVLNVSPPEISGQKAVVRLAMKNNLAEKVESTRAGCFLLDDQGKMVGQSTKWIIGGSPDKPGLEPGATNTFHFVIPITKPLASTNLSAKVSVNRLVLAGGKLADPEKDVRVTGPP